nr:hypothetical protein [Haloterrigena salifodinae]
MIVGILTVIVWIQLSGILEIVGFMSAIEGSAFLVGLVTVYGLVPAFTFSTITLVVIPLVTEPLEGIDEHFGSFNKPLSALSSSDDPTGTPDYVTGGGQDVDSKAATETDNIRAHVTASDYWKTGDE